MWKLLRYFVGSWYGYETGVAGSGTGDRTYKFIMDETNAERKGYLASTQTPNGLIHLISSRQYYVFNLAWLKQPMPAEEE